MGGVWSYFREYLQNLMANHECVDVRVVMGGEGESHESLNLGELGCGVVGVC